MIRKIKQSLGNPYTARIYNLLFLLALLLVVLFCFTRISGAMGMLSQNF